MYVFLQVYGKKRLRKGETEPAQGPDSGVEDTLSGTVDIDGATDTPKKSDRFPSERGQPNRNLVKSLNKKTIIRIPGQPQNSPSFHSDRATPPDTSGFASQ